MVGGAEDDVQRTRGMLSAMGSSTPLVGTAVGDGQKFKVVNQLLCGVHIALADEFDEVKSALNIFVKDMGLVTDAARAASQPVPLTSAAEQLYVCGRKMGLGLKDDSVVTRVV